MKAKSKAIPETRKRMKYNLVGTLDEYKVIKQNEMSAHRIDER